MNNPKKILLIRTDRLGDVILSTPVIENLRIAYPKAHIAFMCRPYTRDVLEGNPYLDEIIIYDKYGRHKNLGGSIKFLFYLRKKKFDWVIVLHPTNRVHIIIFFAGIPFRVGWSKNLPVLLTKKIFHNKQEGKKHELEYTLDLLRAIGVEIRSKKTFFPLKTSAERRIDDLLKDKGFGKNNKLLIVHPSASCPSKRWPQENFLKLIKIMKEKCDLEVAVITAHNEVEFGEKIAQIEGVLDLRGKLTISDVGSLLKKANLFISNDSGPVHISAALNKPVISIFGRGDTGLGPLRWKPLGNNSFYFHKDVGCSSCLAHDCGKNFLCLKEINPEAVAEKALHLLHKE